MLGLVHQPEPTPARDAFRICADECLFPGDLELDLTLLDARAVLPLCVLQAVVAPDASALFACLFLENEEVA